MNIGLLSSKDDLLLSHYVKKLIKIKNLNLFIFYAYKNKTDILRDKRIFQERTKNFFRRNNSEVSKIKKFYFKSHNTKLFKKKIKTLKIDYLFNSGTPNKIKVEIINSVKGIVNIHPGILPDYRGSTCVEWSLYNNDPVGITAHLMSERYDAGPIILKKFIKLNNAEKYEDIRIKVYQECINLSKNIIKILISHKIKKEQKSKKKIYKIIPDKNLNIIKSKLDNNKYKFHKKNFN